MGRTTKIIMSVNALKAATRMADIDNLYRVVERDPHVLKYIDSMQFVETPLHLVAASVDLPAYIEFATEIMRLKPSFALKLNPQGLTPIHLAIVNGCNEMALHLIEMNKDLVRVKIRGGLTPLHLATQYGDICLLTKFLEACPDSIEDETDNSETVLHLAAKCQQFDAFKFLVKSLVKKGPLVTGTILNRKDKDGNTILHIAAFYNAIEAIELLKKGTNYMMDFGAKNSTGQTASDLAGRADIKRILDRASMRDILHRWLGNDNRLMYFRPVTEEKRNAYLVVATLVATATYQAALSPPGGFHQNDLIGTNNTLTRSFVTEGKSIMSHSNFGWYSTMNTYAFLLSTFTIVNVLPNNAASIPLHASIILLIVSFYFSMTVISPDHYTTQVFNSTFGILCAAVSFLIGVRSLTPKIM